MISSDSKSVLEAVGLGVDLGGQPVLDIPTFKIIPGEVMVIIGPNGSGKTTLLLSLAALLKPARGDINFFGKSVWRDNSLLETRRRFAVVFQEPLLLAASVWDNVALGLRLRGVKNEEVNQRTAKWLERLGITQLASRQAKTLSGGEAKRVSLARAFVLQPEVLFLDEPFNALDGPTRLSITEDFHSIINETKVTTVMVTHDRSEAMILADRVAVLINGKIRQIGAPETIFSAPVDQEVAAFIGVGNIWRGKIAKQEAGLASLEVKEQQIYLVSDVKAGTNVTVFLRHEDIILSPVGQSGPSSARNKLECRINSIVPLGAQARVNMDCGIPLVSLITARSVEELGLKPGQMVQASFKASAVHVLSETGAD